MSESGHNSKIEYLKLYLEGRKARVRLWLYILGKEVAKIHTN